MREGPAAPFRPPELLAPATTVPESMSKPPVNVFAPESVRMPVPAIVTALKSCR